MAKERKRLEDLGITVDYGIKGSGVGDVVGTDAAAATPASGASSGTANQNNLPEQLAIAFEGASKRQAEVANTALAALERVALVAAAPQDPAPVTIENHLHQPEVRAGDVKIEVAAPAVSIEPRIEVAPAPVRHPSSAEQTVERDAAGEIVKTVTTYTFEEKP
jgi:hypothetical protein